MATDTAAVHDEVHENDQDMWSGGKEPFKASYGKLMMWYFLLSDAFTFAGFLIAYGALRFSSPTWPVPDFVFSTAPFGIHHAPLIFVTVMSFLLIISSVTMVRAVQEGHRENQSGVVFWMFLTIIGGAGFLGCQAWEWNNLINKEYMTVTRNPFGTHAENGTYLNADGSQSTAADDQFKPGMGYLIHHAHVGEDGAHGHGEGELTAEENFLEDANNAVAAANLDMANLPDKGVDFPGFKLNNEGFIQRKFVTESGVSAIQEYGPKAFGALFFFITGFHGFHVLSGVFLLVIIMLNAAGGIYVARKNGYEMVEKIGLYWHFVDLVWVFVFLVFYLL
ncbi:MAG: cytochrome c oxidase subunit 3 [Bacteroidota bacterium]